MADPITWRTVNGPSLAEASRPLDAAGASINAGFSAFNNVLQKQEATDQANWNQQKVNNTQDFMNKLYEAHGPEAYKALQDSGELNRLIAANGAQIDQAAARSAMDTRLGTLQSRELANIDYTNKVTDNAQAPTLELLKVAAQKGDKVGFDKIVGENPGLRHLSGAYESLRTVGNSIAEQDQLAKMRPLDIQSKQLSIAGQGTQNSLNSLNLKKGTLEYNDMEEVRRLDNTLASAQQKFLSDKDQVGKNMGIIAKGYNSAVEAENKAMPAKINGVPSVKKDLLPLLANGHPDFNNMTSAQLEQFDAEAGKNRMVKVPLAKDFITGDTIQANQFMQTLVDSGKFRPALINKYRDNIRSGFDSNAGSKSVGNDAANKTLANAQNTVKFDEQDAQNWYAPGSPNATKAYEDLAKAVPDLIDSTTGHDSDEDVAHMQAFVHKMGQEGIEVSPGKFLSPSLQDIKNAIRTADGGIFRDAKRSENAEEILRKNVKNSFTTDKLKQAEESQIFRRKQAVQKILESTR